MSGLSYFDKIRIENALRRSAESGAPVRVRVQLDDKEYRVLVTPALDHERVLQARRAPTPD